MTQGIRGAGRYPDGWWSSILARDAFIPPYPGDGVVRAYVIPPPAQVDLDQPSRDVATQLVRAYVTAITEAYGSSPLRVPKPEDVFTLTGALALPKAAKMLSEARIPPVAWCMSSVDFYEAYVPKRARRRFPQLGWVYSVKRLEERVDFHSWMEQSYLGGRVILTDSHRELIRRWKAMHARLARIAASGRVPRQDEVRAAVVEELADWDELRAKADSEYQATAAKYNKRIKNGEYVWSR